MHREVAGSQDALTRKCAMTSKGMVASSHELASFYGARILSEGGKVVDAALATSAMLCVTQNNMCGLGGDLFALVKINDRIYNLNGSGRASENATIRFYRDERKFKRIPHRGPLAALTVPGIVHAWGELHSRFGSFELRKLLAPAIEYARNGFPVTQNYSSSIRASSRFLAQYQEWSEIFLPDGKIPEAGYVLKQKDLADSLEQIANNGPSTFYSGSLSEKIVKGVRAQGGLITEKDLKNHGSTWQTPVKTNYRGIDIYETAPNSQAATVLLWLNMLEEYDLTKKFQIESQGLFEILIDTCLKAYEQRAKHIADPAYLELDPKFLTKEFAHELLRSSLDLVELPVQTKTSKSLGDTTYFAIGNSEGDCVSVIQSNYMGFGSGLVPKGTGIVLHNRGSYFTLNGKHHNSLQPGKRTFHTLCASLGETQSGRTLFSLGCMGGDIQPQVHVQLMTKMLDYGIDPQKAIDLPRWIIPFTIYERPSDLCLEPGLEEKMAKKIVKTKQLSLKTFGSLSSLTGHAQAIQFGEGFLKGAADPRGDGTAIGF
jgi:gamma-glutamyltranspeptidase/glutathione hydrolase